MVQVSPSAETILGYQPEEMIGRNAIEFMHPDDLESARREMRARAQRKSHAGRPRPFSSTRMAERMAVMDGRLVRAGQAALLVGRDMTESRHAEQTLRESAQLARNIVETRARRVRADGRNVRSEAGIRRPRRSFGWPRKEVLGKDLIDLIVVGADQGDLKTARKRFLNSGQGLILGSAANSWCAARRQGVQGRTQRHRAETATDSCSTDYFRDLTKDRWAGGKDQAVREDGSDRPAHRRHRA